MQSACGFPFFDEKTSLRRLGLASGLGTNLKSNRSHELNHSGIQPPSAFLSGLTCKCPRCGVGSLYKSAWSLDIVPRCPACSLDYVFADSGDGPAVFAIMLLGFLMLGAALILEFKVGPPWWAHAIWAPITMALALGLLRPMKATLIALQYRNKAEQGRLK